MEKNIVKLNEEQLRQIVAESVKKVLKESFEGEDVMNENDAEEGFFNQVGTAAKTFFSNQNGNKGNLKDRFSAAKKNYQTQGEMDNLQGIINGLSQLLDARKISPQTTVAQLVGGKYNQGKFGTMTGMMNNRQRQMNSRM